MCVGVNVVAHDKGDYIKQNLLHHSIRVFKKMYYKKTLLLA